MPFVAFSAIPFAPEEAEAMEIGFKLGYERLRINGAIFATDYVNLQTLPGDIAPTTLNAGESEINGFELEGTFTHGIEAYLTTGFKF